MSRLGINTGNNPNDGQGDPLRVAMGKINSNFQEVYNTLGDGFTLTSYASTAGISTLARNLTGSPRINVSGILNTGITTTEHLEVTNIKSVGVVTAVQFVGDGSQLSNVTALVGGLEVLDDNVRKGIARELNFGANIVSTGPDGVGRVTISVSPTVLLTGITTVAGYATTAGISTYSQISGISSYSNLSGVSTYATTAGIATFAQTTGNVAYASSSGISTVSKGLTGTPNISVNQVGVASYLTVTGVSTFYNNVHFDYDKYVLIGANDELQLFHNGSNSYIDNSSANNLIIRTHGGSIVLSKEGPENMGVFNTDGSVELYYDNVKKFETLGAGVTISGTLFANQIISSGVVTATTFIGNITGTATTSTTVDITNTNGLTTIYYPTFVENRTNGQILRGDVDLTYRTDTNTLTVPNINATLISVGSAVTVTSGGLNSSGIITASSFRPSGGYIQAADGTNSFYIYGGTGNVAFQGTIGASQINNASGFKVIGFASTDITFENNANVAGILTASIFTGSDFRIKSSAEKTTVVSGNTISLVYNAGGGNIAICTNPSGDITLNVTGIPTDSTFNNHSLTFSVIVSNVGTARSCTTLTLNGVSTTIKWFGGSLAAAISGVTTTTGYDIYNFTGINTVGSASTTSNYIILGSVNGGYR